ncbi:thyroid hormone-inducible hepatic protein [Alosa sapidissima]|uniref:thyroid hormone-inducible hepatic protein n=2 Tax=Alosa TaxID=34772 RepID=UPI001C08E03A|nr:thyroid hormone-inducible hepatic protein [Alosa sapidissima]
MQSPEKLKALLAACLVTTTTNNTFGHRQDKRPSKHPGTMQSAEAKLSRNSLLLLLKRYSMAVHNMEQTVLIPSLLREVPSDDVLEQDTAFEDAKDLYECYLMLKSIRNTVDSGLVSPHDDTKVRGQAGLHKSLEPLLDADPDVLFRFHLKGLFTVMGHLTKSSKNLTAKYMDIIGISN